MNANHHPTSNPPTSNHPTSNHPTSNQTTSGQFTHKATTTTNNHFANHQVPYYPVFEITKKVNERLEYLKLMEEDIETRLKKFPRGKLYVAPGTTPNAYRYYIRKNPQDKLGEYLDKSKESLRDKLAYKKYYSILQQNVEEEIRKLERIQKLQVADSITETYRKLNPGVKKLINPISVDNSTLEKAWREIPYEGLEFDPSDETEYYSELKERMRSKSEVLIANEMLHNNIPYKYECPITRKNGELLYPDFTILDIKRRRVVYWEHLGRMGDMDYVMKNIWKLDEYKKMGIYLGVNLFLTFESGMKPLGTNEILAVIKEIREDLPN